MHIFYKYDKNKIVTDNMNILDCQSCFVNFKMYLKLYKHRNASLKLNSKLNKRF